MTWFFENIVWAGVAMILVLALRLPAARLFGAGTAYALWLLPLFRLIAPPQHLFSTEIPSLLPPLTIAVEAGETAASLPPDGGPGQWAPILLALWAGGAAVFAVWQWLAYRAFLARISASSRSVGRHGGLPLIESAAVDGPVAVGLLDRRIVIPPDFAARYAPEERRLALQHECIHHRRRDIWWNLAALTVLAINWFNPFAWVAFRAFRADQELACDAAVAARASPSERHDYARAMIKSASRPGLIAACPLNHADQLKRRLKMMNTHRIDRIRRAGGAAAVTALVVAGLTVGSPGAAAQEEKQEKKVHKVIILNKAGEGEHARVREGRARAFSLRRGEDGEFELPEGCSDGSELVNVAEQSGERRTRTLLCGHAGAPAAERLEMLESARSRLAEDEYLEAEHRERVLAAIDREIARLRAN